MSGPSDCGVRPGVIYDWKAIVEMCCPLSACVCRDALALLCLTLKMYALILV